MVVVAFIALTGLPGPWGGHLLTPITWQEYAAITLYCLFVNFTINDRAKLMLGRFGISR
ncbi:hypothetical protein [Vulcanisaeta distributa]|uniref:hypothetical protein n=1 Tax=Vulcanisaeta distributa TaxID=164451 RepID=UPI000AE671BE|nr:hypothetical protein [Vulcanisaeta distributa]